MPMWGIELNGLVQVAVPVVAAILASWLTFKSQKADRRNNRETRLEDRLSALEKKLDKVQVYLRKEQRFSHGLVLQIQTVIHYLSQVVAYRERHKDSLPEGLPELPNIAELKALLDEKPRYDDEADK